MRNLDFLSKAEEVKTCIVSDPKSENHMHSASGSLKPSSTLDYMPKYALKQMNSNNERRIININNSIGNNYTSIITPYNSNNNNNNTSSSNNFKSNTESETTGISNNQRNPIGTQTRPSKQNQSLNSLNQQNRPLRTSFSQPSMKSFQKLSSLSSGRRIDEEATDENLAASNTAHSGLFSSTFLSMNPNMKSQLLAHRSTMTVKQKSSK